MSAASNRMNEIMTFLTVFTTFFIPVNFVTSYYGMNLIMPETHLAITYPIVIALLAVMIAFMYVWFRRKHWL
jgi:magnesium transporter